MTNSQVTNPQCQKLAERLRAAGERTQAFFEAIEGDQWHEEIYADGDHWAVRHVLAHFVATEAWIKRLIQYVLQGQPGVPENFDLDKFNQREVKCFAKLPAEMVLARFAERRAETVDFVLRLQDADLQTQGRHPWLGMATVEEMLKLLYLHNQVHQRDIRNVLDS